MSLTRSFLNRVRSNDLEKSHKYLRREKKNGKWVYTYNEPHLQQHMDMASPPAHPRPAEHTTKPATRANVAKPAASTQAKPAAESKQPKSPKPAAYSAPAPTPAKPASMGSMYPTMQSYLDGSIAAAVHEKSKDISSMRKLFPYPDAAAAALLLIAYRKEATALHAKKYDHLKTHGGGVVDDFIFGIEDQEEIDGGVYTLLAKISDNQAIGNLAEEIEQRGIDGVVHGKQ